MKHRRILLLGGSGRLGKELKAHLIRNQHDVQAPGRDLVDISRREHLMSSYLKQWLPDVVINCAAYNGPENCEENRELALSVNGMAPAYLANYCAEIGALLVHFSSDYAVADGRYDQITEESTWPPVNYYGRTKLIGEKAIVDQNPKHLILRVASLFGSDDFSGILDVIKQARAGRGSKDNPIEVLKQHCSPISFALLAMLAFELIDAYFVRGDTSLNGIYNCVTTGAEWKRDLASFILRQALPKYHTATIKTGELKVKRPIHCGLSNTKLQSLLGEIPTAREDILTTLQSMKARGILPEMAI